TFDADDLHEARPRGRRYLRVPREIVRQVPLSRKHGKPRRRRNVARSRRGRVFHCVRLAHHTFIRRVARRDFVEGSSGIGGASGLVPPRPVRGFRGVAIVVVAGVLLSAARDSARSSFAISISFRPRGFPDGTCQTFNLPPRCPEEIIRLEHWGCPWSRDEDGRVSQRAFGGMSVKRTVYAADKVGFHILHTLFQTSMKYDRIHRFDEYFVTSLIVDGGACAGVVAMNLRGGTMVAIQGKATILATGGCGRVYEFTTNGFIKTGDGMALAYRAGVPLKDMEMVQFHPTCLPGTGILITEAARGEGGVLVNKEGERYMQRYLPGKMELGPRDILSRAMIQEMKAGRAFEGTYGPYLGLDLRHLGEKRIKERIPMVRELAEKYMGLDPVHELIPVRPGQHYIMGGVSTGL